MVLLIEGEPLHSIPDENVYKLFEDHPTLFKSALALAKTRKKFIQPDGVVYVRQKEDAITFNGDRLRNGEVVRFCGTEDVLTCHVVILRSSGVVAIAHFDEYVTEARLGRMVNLFRGFVEERRNLYEFDEDGEEEEEWEWEEYEEEEEEEFSKYERNHLCKEFAIVAIENWS